MRAITAVAFITFFSFIAVHSLSGKQVWTTYGPSYKVIKAVSFSPQDSNTVFAGAFGWGVFRSTDGGATWSNSRNNFVNSYVRSVTAVSNTTVFSGTNDGVYKSVDGGVTWAKSLPTAFSVRSIAYDNQKGSLYAGTFGTGMFKSTNLGGTWNALSVTDGVVAQTLLHIWTIALFGKDSLYAGGSLPDVSTGGALFRSLDGGASWIQVQRGTHIGSSIHSIAINPLSPPFSLILGTAARGVYRSSNGGLTWSNISDTGVANTLPDFKINTVAFGKSLRYAGTDSLGGAYVRSASDGTTGWTAGIGLPGASSVVSTIVLNPSNASTLFLGTEGVGTFRSTDAGFHWTQRNTGMLGTAVREIRRNSNGMLIAGCDFGDGIWRSSDDGINWQRAESLGTADAITSISTTSSASMLYAAAFGTGVFKSTDGGLTWFVTDTTVINHLSRTVDADPANTNIAYAGTGDGVYKTTNGGASWGAVNSGIPPLTSVRSAALDATNGSNIYIGTDSLYMFKTTNAGASWTHITNANGFLPQDKFIRSITIDYASSSTIYAGVDSGRIYRSTDAGTTWALFSSTGGTHSVRSILIHPNDHSHFFAASFGDGLFHSADSGKHWLAMNAGLVDTEYYVLESDHANPLTLFAGSGDLGAYRTMFTTTNRPPVLSPIGGKAVLAGSLLTFRVTATDSDGTIPALSAAGIPPGALFTDSLNGHGAFSWTPLIADTGLHVVTFRASDGKAVDSEVVNITVVNPSHSSVVESGVFVGWNLLSIPVTLNDYRKRTLFPSATSQAFAYTGSYVIRDTLGTGSGYWLKFSSAGTQTYGGGTIDRETVAVRSNWNIIGSISRPVHVSAVHPVPPVAVLSNFYSYNGTLGYAIADSIRPGRGYWVKTDQAGTMSIGPAPLNTPRTAVSAVAQPAVESGVAATLVFTTASGGSRMLRFVNVDGAAGSGTLSELPPPPPGGALDVRFRDHQSDCEVVRGEGVPVNVEISSAEDPVVRWEIKNPGLAFDVIVRGEDDPQRFTISGKGNAILHIASGLAIAAFTPVHGPVTQETAVRRVSLSDNYPNPFNPSTVIRYAIPARSEIRLTVFDILGRTVAELVHGEVEPGEHSVRWNVDHLSSGVYYYRLEVVPADAPGAVYRETKKMFLIR